MLLEQAIHEARSQGPIGVGALLHSAGRTHARPSIAQNGRKPCRFGRIRDRPRHYGVFSLNHPTA